MNRQRLMLLAPALLLAAWFALACTAQAGRVVLRIQAGNPVEKEQRVEIKSNLPEGVRTEHVLSLGGLELGYDVKNDIYFVHRDLTLGPKQIQVFDVEIEDIWEIPDAELQALQTHSRSMVELLQGKPPAETGATLEKGIGQNLDRIVQFQAENRIGPGVPPLNHIRAYDSNSETLKRVKIDVGRLENLVLGTGQDPGGLSGDEQRSPNPERFLESPEKYTKTAVIRITVENTSPNRRRGIPVRQDLPDEIREFDVLDTGGLDLTTDAARGVAYVYKQTLELDAREQRTFSVVIRDKWNISESRIVALKKTAADLFKRVAARENFKSVEAALQKLIDALEAVAKEQGPATVDAQYVAFYRNQAARLDEIENKLNRIVMALPQIERTSQMGFKVKAPSAKTTWLMIYIILGFLATLSILFYFRWYGKSKAD